MDSMTCANCGKSEVEFMREVIPYSMEHFWCEECNSTFQYAMYSEVFEEHLVKQLHTHIWRRAASMYGVDVTLKSVEDDYGEDFIKGFLERHKSKLRVYGTAITLTEWMK